MREDSPLRPNGHKGQLRVRMWRDALAAHEAGRCRVTELRASDYLGPGASAGTSVVNTYVVAPTVAGKSVRMPMGRVDVPHSWTYLADIGALAAALAQGGGWGRAWHVPTLPPMTVRGVAADVARAAGVPEPAVSHYPRLVVSVGGVFSPLLRELWETRHQFERPFVLDSAAAQDRFGLTPTPWDAQLSETVAWLKAQPATRD